MTRIGTPGVGEHTAVVFEVKPTKDKKNIAMTGFAYGKDLSRAEAMLELQLAVERRVGKVAYTLLLDLEAKA